jgi:hypothetical protein
MVRTFCIVQKAKAEGEAEGGLCNICLVEKIEIPCF